MPDKLMKFSQHEIQRQQQRQQQALQDSLNNAQLYQWQQEGTEETSTEDVGTGGSPSGEPDKLLSALQKEREANKEAQKKLKTLEAQMRAFEGVDPELARKAQDLAKREEEIESRISKVKSEIEGEFQPRLQQAEEEKKALFNAAVVIQSDIQFESACNMAGLYPGDYEVIAPLIYKRVQITGEPGEKGRPKVSVKVLDAEGKPAYVDGKPMTIPQLVEELKHKSPAFGRHFKGTDTRGAGLTGSGRYVGNRDISHLSPWEQVNAMREAKGQ